MNSFASAPSGDPDHELCPPVETGRVPRRNPRRRNLVTESAPDGAVGLGHVVVDELNVGFEPANLRRCPGCGGMVYLWPCLACVRRNAA